MDEGPGPELSSLSSALQEVRDRIRHLAEECAGGELDAVGQQLFEVERSLDEGGRRLARLLRQGGASGG